MIPNKPNAYEPENGFLGIRRQIVTAEDKMSKRERMYARIEAHGKNLLDIFPAATMKNPIALCKALRRWEGKASRITTDYCNGVFDAGENGERLDAALDHILAKVNELLGNTGAVPVFINRDPRGYALKIEDSFILENHKGAFARLHKDWGRYGILAPEFNDEK